jgi:hypothetical protein
MNQRTIFDITPAPEPEPVSQVVEPELERSPQLLSDSSSQQV